MAKCKNCGRTINSNEFFHQETDTYSNPDGVLCESCYKTKYKKKCSKCGKEYADWRATSSVCPECYGKNMAKFICILIVAGILLGLLFAKIAMSISCGSPSKPKYENGVDRYINDGDFRNFVDENKAYDND